MLEFSLKNFEFMKFIYFKCVYIVKVMLSRNGQFELCIKDFFYKGYILYSVCTISGNKPMHTGPEVVNKSNFLHVNFDKFDVFTA